MAAVAAPVRVPFAPLDSPRLQALANAKNRQNGAILALADKAGKAASGKIFDKPALTSTLGKPVLTSSLGKRAADSDDENVDPRVASPKKAKALDYAVKPVFSLKVAGPRASIRSPPRKLAAPRRATRIDPPSLSLGASSSLNAALARPAMPKDWFFAIYEDTPDERAANLMEHGAATLDLAADETKADRGKENTPPAGYDVVAASRPVRRTRKVKVPELDDGQRTPLSDLETDPFIPEGLDKDAVVVVDDMAAGAAFDVKDLFGKKVDFTAKK